MMSKNLFFKRMKHDLEQRVWLPVLFFIISFLCMEIPLISEFDYLWSRAGRQSNMPSAEFFAQRADEYLLNTFFAPNSAILFLTIAMAVVSALSGFVFMHSAKKLDVYHSIPVKRERLFFQQYVYGVLYYIIPLIIHILICLGICMANNVLTFSVGKQALGCVLVQFIIYLTCYGVAIAAVCLTGNLVISVLGCVVLFMYSYILSLLKSELMDKFLVTSYLVDAQQGVWAFSPMHLLANMMMALRVNDDFVYLSGMGYYVKFIFMAVLYTAIALYLYKKRPTEMAGRTMVFSMTEPIVKTMVVFPVSIFSGYFLSGITSGNNELAWFVFGCIFGFIICCPLMEIIFRKDVKAVLHHPLQLVFNGVLLGAILVILQFDLFGYDTYIPKENKVESYAVYCYNLANVNPGDGSAQQYSLDNMTITDNESTRKLLEHAAQITRPARTGKMEASEENDEARYSAITVKYNLKNGKDIYRSYLINTAEEQVMQWLGDTYNDLEFKKGTYPVLAEDKDKNYVGVILEYAFASESIQLPKEKMQKFVETYQKELKMLTLDEIRTEYPVVNLSLAMVTDSQMEYTTAYAVEEKEYREGPGFHYNREEWGYEIYPSFTQTLALLEEYGAEIKNELSAEDVISLSINDYSREVNDHDGLYTKQVELQYTKEDGQLEQIAQILPNLVSNQMMNRFVEDELVEPHVDVSIRYYHDGQEMHEGCRFRMDSMPQFLKDDMEKVVQQQEAGTAY